MLTELLRYVRHLAVPIVAFLFEKGLVPESAQEETVEAVTLLLTFALVILASKYREKGFKGESRER